MGIDFYYTPSLTPSRAVQMTAKALNIPMNLINIDTFTGEQLTKEFLKINPQHIIPTLVDDGFSIWESRAIMIYLNDQYGDQNDELYPSDPQHRAIVNQRLQFDMSVLYSCLTKYWYPQLFHQKQADPIAFERLQEAVKFLDIFLTNQTYVAGNQMTLADFSIAATIATLHVTGFDFEQYKNVQKWYKLCEKTMPGFDLNLYGAQEFRKYFDNI